jgi:hypothetical protein
MRSHKVRLNKLEDRMGVSAKPETHFIWQDDDTDVDLEVRRLIEGGTARPEDRFITVSWKGATKDLSEAGAIKPAPYRGGDATARTAAAATDSGPPPGRGGNLCGFT